MVTSKVDVKTLIGILMGLERGQFISVVMERKVRMNKTNNPYYDKIIKRTIGNYLVGNGYENRVQNNEEKEGLERKFKTEPHSVGAHVSRCVLYNQKLNTYYLQMERFDETQPFVTEYIFEGKKINESLFSNFVQQDSESRKQVQNRKVKYINPKMETIKEITIGKQHYIVKH